MTERDKTKEIYEDTYRVIQKQVLTLTVSRDELDKYL